MVVYVYFYCGYALCSLLLRCSFALGLLLCFFGFDWFALGWLA